MAEHVIDLTNYKSTMSDYVSPGRYTVVVEDAESDKSKAGNPMVNVWLRVQGGEYDGATIVDRLVLTEKSLFRVVGFLQAIGIPTPKKRIKINTNSFLGKALKIDVEDGEPYNGKVKPEVRGYGRLPKKDDTEPEDLDEDGLSEFESDDEEAEEIEEVTPAPKKKAKSEEVTVPADEAEDIDLDDIDLG